MKEKITTEQVGNTIDNMLAQGYDEELVLRIIFGELELPPNRSAYFAASIYDKFDRCKRALEIFIFRFGDVETICDFLAKHKDIEVTSDTSIAMRGWSVKDISYFIDNIDDVDTSKFINKMIEKVNDEEDLKYLYKYDLSKLDIDTHKLMNLLYDIRNVEAVYQIAKNLDCKKVDVRQLEDILIKSAKYQVEWYTKREEKLNKIDLSVLVDKAKRETFKSRKLRNKKEMIEQNIPKWIYLFAKDIKGADVNRLYDALIEMFDDITIDKFKGKIDYMPKDAEISVEAGIYKYADVKSQFEKLVKERSWEEDKTETL